MALFLVPRYEGNGKKEEGNGPQNVPRLLLRRLQEKALLREKQKAQQSLLISGPEIHEENEVLGSKDESKVIAVQIKAKKRKRDKVGRKIQNKKHKDEDFGETDPGMKAADPEEGEGGEEEQDGSLSAPERSPNSAPLSAIVLGRCSHRTVHKVRPPLPPLLSTSRRIKRRIKANLLPLAGLPHLHPTLVKKLQANGIEAFFPVQAEVIPAILSGCSSGFLAGRGGFRPSDLCVSAPTGSGKTLAFVVPIVQALLGRVVCQVRALVVLPTKELAQQVSKVFNLYTDGTGLKVVQITGQKPFAKEQESLVEETLNSFRSLADIVVATPGRLVDHLQETPHFRLGQLRFLVIDEADRMVDGMHQDWLKQVTQAVFREQEAGAAGTFERKEEAHLTAARASVPRLPFQKLLFSATLMRDAEKLQALRLFRPRLFMPEEEEEEEEGGEEEEKKYTLPEGLSQYFVPCSLRWKPLFLLHFLLRLKFSRVLCFVNSKETSHRLFLLVKAFGGVSVAEFSSRLTPNQRRATLKEFERGKIQLLISTDATARGIDIDGVKCVISYEAPQFIRSYIHRVGRTARAGRAGLAFTLLLKQQESRFLRMLSQAGLPAMGQQTVKVDEIQPMVPRYQEALQQLQEAVQEERAEKLS
ncbi:ATP-dependent RNA helicase DDX51 [Anolis carolinensis]|uniref:ATP-dependent RNA helicase DDX51 n=1 Tax=Anolis carolinensis TaxID=28377 RepID=UPI002F2B8406